MRTVAIFLSDPFGRDRVDFDLEPLMKASYEEAVAQLRMRPYRPTLDRLPAAPLPSSPDPSGGGEKGNAHAGRAVIVDPTTTPSRARAAWVGAKDTQIGEASKGIAKLTKSVTYANVWAAEAEHTRGRAGGRQGPRGRKVQQQAA